MHHHKALVLLIAAALVSLCAGRSNAAEVRSPAAVTGNTLGDFDTSTDIGQTIDQSGLYTPFVSGVDDFDTYFASGSTHSLMFYENEWYAQFGVSLGQITYDLGAEYSVSGLALWNEDAFGLASVAVSTSNDAGFGSSTLVGAFAPTDNAYAVDYLAEVVSLLPTDARYVRLDVVGASGEGTEGPWASMGEIAFRTDVPQGSAVPDGGGTAILLGLTALGLFQIRRAKA